MTGGFPSQKASNLENVSIWWRHHAVFLTVTSLALEQPYKCPSANEVILKDLGKSLTLQKINAINHNAIYVNKGVLRW